VRASSSGLCVALGCRSSLSLSVSARVLHACRAIACDTFLRGVGVTPSCVGVGVQGLGGTNNVEWSVLDGSNADGGVRVQFQGDTCATSNLHQPSLVAFEVTCGKTAAPYNVTASLSDDLCQLRVQFASTAGCGKELTSKWYRALSAGWIFIMVRAHGCAQERVCICAWVRVRVCVCARVCGEQTSDEGMIVRL
jgi:hypothetical protein